MAIRDILFPMLSYPTATATDSVERAVALAAGLGARIVGVTFELDIRSPGVSTHIPSTSVGSSPLNARKAPPIDSC
jgi:hypothetical protein